MAKNKVSEWSATPANNTDVGGIDINEGCAPSGINNAIREVMAQVKDMITGADGDSQVVGGNLTVNGTSTLTGAVTAPAGLTANLTGNVTGDVTGNVSGTAANVTGTVAVANGGTGLATLTANNVILGNGTSSPSFVAPSTSGNVLTSNGTTWTSVAPAGGIGIGQTWQNVTGSRSGGSTYTNNTGKPIFVSVTSDGEQAGVRIIVGGNEILRQSGALISGVMYANATFIVPNGVTYRADFTAGVKYNWSELR
jgi:hypothetical protein